MKSEIIIAVVFLIILGVASTFALIRLKRFGGGECTGCPFRDSCDNETSGKCQKRDNK